MRELVNDLAKKYGPNSPFDEELFFDELVQSTYPEVSDFINNYIEGTEQLPLKEYFEFVLKKMMLHKTSQTKNNHHKEDI